MRTKCLVVCLFGLLLSASSSFAVEMRKWTIDGKQVEAEFAKREGSVITLRKPDGTEIKARRSQLCEEDTKYLQKLLTVRIETGAMRKWTIDGKQVEAKLIRFTPWAPLLLEQPDGKKIHAPFTRISEADRNYAHQVIDSQTTPEPTHVSKKQHGKKPHADETRVAHKDKPAPKEPPADQKVQQPEKKPKSPAEFDVFRVMHSVAWQSSAEPAAKSSTGGGLLAKVAARREHEKQTVEALSAAFEGFPLNCLKAEVVGEPEEVTHDQATTTLRVKVRVQKDIEKFQAFRKRLFAALDKFADDRVVLDHSQYKDADGRDFFDLLCLGPSGRQDLEQKFKEQVKQAKAKGTELTENYLLTLETTLRNQFFGDDFAAKKLLPTHVVLQVSTDDKESDKLNCRWYTLFPGTQAVLDKAMTRSCECRLSSVDAARQEVLLKKFPVGLECGGVPPDAYYVTLMDNHSDESKKLYTVSNLFLAEHWSREPKLTMKVDFKMADTELKAMRNLKCELRLLETLVKGR